MGSERGGGVARGATMATWFATFMCASVGMVLCNKAVMTEYNYSFSLLLMQNVSTVLLNFAGVRIGLFKLEEFTMAQFKTFMVPTIFFTLMLATSLKALPLVAVATVVVFRNVGTCLVALGDYHLFGKTFSSEAKLALATIVGGSVVYAATDINFDFWGYFWVILNTSFVVINQLYEKYAVTSMSQTAVGISCIQNILSVPVLVIVALISGETGALADLLLLDGTHKMLVVVTCFAGCLLSVCYMSLNKIASATAITVANNCNKAVSVAIGAFVFRNSLTVFQLFGLAMAMGGAYWFSQANSRPAPADEEAEKDAAC